MEYFLSDNDGDGSDRRNDQSKSSERAEVGRLRL